MLSVLATTKKKKKVPKPHDDPKIEYSKFTALPPEKNVPKAAVVLDIAADAEEVEPEPEEIDEWQVAMQAAEEEDVESEVASRTDDLEPSLDDERFERSDDDEPFFPEVVLRRNPKQTMTYEGRPLEFDDEYIP